jgi:tetratricopeptide (TPR) repeat protein/predicted Ser/Thr protein kinase
MNEKLPQNDSLPPVDAELIGAARQEVEAAKLRDVASDGATLESPGNRELTFSGPPPESFVGYQILKELHRGGQGVVYQALQQSTKRKVAIKVMKEGPFAGSADRARFDREVQVLGQLNHPSVVAIHDTGVAAGCHYFVMDYISGQPLDVYMASGARSIDQTLRLFAKICDAINAAHLRGVIHRDLKPGNIRIDADGEPHILDFGLAKVATSEAEAAAMTMTGQFIGSLPWASPEQAEGSPAKIDIRTDVYSLGVILYQMLTGKFPYEVIGGMRDVLDRIMKAEPLRPRTIRKQIDDEVETITLQCLAKERDRRYQTAGELARDVRRYLAAEPIEAKRDSAWYVLRKALARYKVPLSTAAAFVVMLIAFSATMALLYQRATYAEQTTRTALGTAQEERDRAEAALEEMERAWRMAWSMRLEAAHELQHLYARLGIAEGKLTLQQPVPEFIAESLPLEQTMDFLGWTSLNIVVRWQMLEDAGIERDTPVTFDCKNVTLDECLRTILTNAANGRDVPAYRAHGNSLVVSTKADLDDEELLDRKNLGFFGEHEVRVAGVVDEVPAIRFRLLDQRVPEFWLDRQPVSEAVEKLQDVTGMELICRWDELNAVGVRRDKLLTIRMRNLPVYRILGMLMYDSGGEDSHIAWSLDRDRIIVSSRGDLEKWIATQPAAVAQRLVNNSLDELPTVEDVIERLRSDSTLSDRVRKQAIWMAESFREDPWKLDAASRTVAAASGHHTEAYRAALRKAERACRSSPDRPYFLNTLGVAQYRVGAYEDALATLTRADEINSERVKGGRPADVAFLAMTLHQLGRTEEAYAALERLRALLESGRWVTDEEARSFLREAESLICLPLGTQPASDASTSPDPVGERSSQGSTSTEDADNPRP